MRKQKEDEKEKAKHFRSLEKQEIDNNTQEYNEVSLTQFMIISTKK